MINLLEEFEKLIKELPLPHGKKPVLMQYHSDGYFQKIAIPCSPRSIITIYMYQDDLQIACYVYENNRWTNYQLLRILNKRARETGPREKQPAFSSLDELLLYYIRCAHFLLLQYGDDVLKGDLEWIKEYTLTPLPAGDLTYFLEKNNITF